MHPRLPHAALALLMSLPVQAAKPPAVPPPPLPGDAMIDAYLVRIAREIDGRASEDYADAFRLADGDSPSWKDDWRAELRVMLGLPDVLARGPLVATVSGTLTGDGYVVEKLHYQSRPGLYVTANLYRPATANPGERLPAVLYVCGHSNQGRNGNKISYQSFGIWFARHGYVCLIIDTVGLGEIRGQHHGLYREGRWWWVPCGYTPAGVECLNGMRGIDYLVSRKDVDPERIAVTGISGGGSYTITIAALDDRVKVAVPVSGISDLKWYVEDRGIDVHCDCMFMYNTKHWPWARIASLIAPRPMLLVNSDADRLFPMASNERITNYLERIYAGLGAGDRFDAMVSIGDHDYRADILQATYRFINTWLKNDPHPVTDSESSLPTRERDPQKKKEMERYFIRAEDLRVFPRDEDLPKDEINTTIDQHFTEISRAGSHELLGTIEQFTEWKNQLLQFWHGLSLEGLSLLDGGAEGGTFSPTFPTATAAGRFPSGVQRLQSEEGIFFGFRKLRAPAAAGADRILLALTGPEGAAKEPPWLERIARPRDIIYLCETRGCGETRWNDPGPPNRIARSHLLLGRTVDLGRMIDVGATALYLEREYAGRLPVHVAGRGAAGVIAAYAALWGTRAIAGATVIDPPSSHLDNGAPLFIGLLRIADIPEMLGALAPKQLTLIGASEEMVRRVREIYAVAQTSEKLEVPD